MTQSNWLHFYLQKRKKNLNFFHFWRNNISSPPRHVSLCLRNQWFLEISKHATRFDDAGYIRKRETSTFSYAGCVSVGRASCHTTTSFQSAKERSGEEEGMTPKSVHLWNMLSQREYGKKIIRIEREEEKERERERERKDFFRT